MSSFALHVLYGIDQFQTHADDWNDLWQRSFTAQPTVRAEGIENWMKHFGQGAPLVTFVVESEGRFLAALPLIRSKLRGIYTCYELPVNCWANSGDLLLDREADTTWVLESLVQGLIDSSVSLLFLEEVSLDSPQWVEFQAVLRRGKHEARVANAASVGLVDVLHDWNRYQASWSGNHRNAIRRSHRRLCEQGEVSVERHRNVSGQQLQRFMQQAFDIEDRSWKGEAGTSVHRTSGMFDYMVEEAQLVARHGFLDLWFLQLDGVPIAFEYCHYAKGTCFSHKIGYDPKYRRLGPGRLLRYFQLQEYHGDPNCQLLDTLGFLCDSKAKWATRTARVGKIVASVGSPLNALLVQAYALASKVRGPSETSILPNLGAASCLEGIAWKDSPSKRPSSVGFQAEHHG